MKSFVAVLLVALVAPSLAAKFYFKGTFSLPYANVTQPLEVNVDGQNAHWNFFDGTERTVLRADGTHKYVHVRKDHFECIDVATEPGETVAIPNFLPDLTDGWKKVGMDMVRGIPVEKYVSEMSDYQKTSTYEFYQTVSGTPVQYRLLGYNQVFGSHYDLYVLEYHVFRSNYNQPGAYELPSMCGDSNEKRSVGSRTANLLTRHFGAGRREEINDEFQAWAAANGKVYASPEEANKRSKVYAANIARIEAHNVNPAFTFELAANHLADRTHEEIVEAMTGGSRGPSNGIADAPVYTGEGVEVPASIDHRVSGAAGVVKDQCSCGSCWAMATTAMLEGRYAVQKGEFVQLSDQNLVNCFWSDKGKITGRPTLGCNGGEPFDCVDWLVNQGGRMSLQVSSPFLGIDSWCEEDKLDDKYTPSKYYRVDTNIHAMKAALMGGPVAVAIDVVETLSFYSRGVYNDPACKSAEADLKHGVAVEGFVTTIVDGKETPVYVIKNSWSTHWGNNGYVYILADEKNVCGVLTSATIADYE